VRGQEKASLAKTVAPAAMTQVSERWNETRIILFGAKLSCFEEGFIHSKKKGGGVEKTDTIKLRNEREMICISAHPEAEKLKEQHHTAQHAHTQILLALHWLLFE
jgi:hypothetical protein